MRLGQNETTKKAMATKPSILALALAALGGGAVVFVLLQLQFSVWIEPSANKDSTPPVIEVAPSATVEKSLAPPSPIVPQAPLVNGLRVRNISPYPVRVVLLSQQVGQPASPANPYRSPVHWDFDPNEGSKAGLLLSLPEGNFTLKSGDVLVAFALDGSRRYWGPYVVGKAGGLSRSVTLEWQLILSP
jgi:hypothetical protein